jgi:ATP-dependent Clp protease adaptor protein ClpS
LTTQPLEKLDRQAKLYDPYKVLLHNDDHNSQEHVVVSISKAVPQISRQQAEEIMEEAHTTGVALVIACPLEHAEMYADRLKSFGLTSSIERGD